MINGCPYKAPSTDKCTHKGCKLNKKSDRYCEYEKADNCELFEEWLALNKESQKPTLKSLKTTN